MVEKGRMLGVTGGAVGLGGFAAALGLCCGVPWAVPVLGVAGAIAIARLEFLLPYALVAAAGLLAVGFWLAYGPRSRCVDGTCGVSNTRAARWIVWIGTVLVAALTIVAAIGRY